MKPLIVLLGVFVLAFAIMAITGSGNDPRLAARIAMSAMLVFTSIAHFVFTKGMSMMLPPAVPARQLIIYLTGVLELILAVCLLVPPVQVVAGWITILFFIVMLPANIYAASNYVNYEKGTRDGKGPPYLWIRIPMQVFFIAWVYYAALYHV